MARRRRGEDITGVLLLDKAVDLSSNQALQRARRLFNANKAGHTGTLDPFATGLLVCCFGRATKISTNMLAADKSYRATLSLGAETDSGDLTGEIVAQAELAGIDLTKDRVLAVLQQFIGEIQQIPPMHSALKRDGKPLYEYARQGIELEREPRQVTIYSIDLIELAGDQLVLDVACSKGTYIRTLAQDIGRALGCFAYLKALRRLSVGDFHLDNAVTLDQLHAEVETDPATLQQHLIPLEKVPARWVPEKLLK
ncbi:MULTISPECIES: tRNA pseudouridine(55) synthase TruB [Oligella]|uniref:tRNA pseudouridine synthase B n=1 Tax=Oligella urethralis DNF00040 TaxID=1401065 RepID=A0A096AEP7_9BURK|nr:MULTISPECIES: tRNA pseudouridine(55) synthase TruB [Oligella]KGF29182.1 tRNA pseudouridine synthase B [Oligella urethralis DNF00040]OFS84527.1 tRNA pseudouridine(55) synthase [Oligella sp. HMSC05A10]